MSEFDEAIDNVTLAINRYTRFQRENDVEGKDFYSSFEKTVYCDAYSKVCRYYEKEIVAAAKSLAKAGDSLEGYYQ